MLYPLRKRKYNPKGDSGIISAACSISKGGATVSFSTSPESCWGRAKCWQSCGGDAVPQGPRKEEYQTKEDASQALKSNGICPPGLCTYSEPVTSFFFPMNPFEKENVSHARSTTVLWKLVTCLVSQVHSQRGILLQDESSLLSQPYLIQMRLGTWKLMQERVDNLGVNVMEWIHFACDETMNFGEVGRVESTDNVCVPRKPHVGSPNHKCDC